MELLHRRPDRPCSVEFQQIMREAEQLPLRFHLPEASERETIKPACRFDLPKYRFHRTAAHCVECLPRAISDLPAHPQNRLR